MIAINPTLAQSTYSYTSKLITYENDYTDKTEATLKVTCFDKNYKVIYTDQVSQELINFTNDSVNCQYKKGSTVICGRGSKTDYFKEVNKTILNKRDLKVNQTNNRDMIAGFFCEEIVVSYNYGVGKLAVTFDNHLWITGGLDIKSELNLTDFTDTWAPKVFKDSINNAGIFIMKQLVYFNNELIGKSEIEDFYKTELPTLLFEKPSDGCDKYKKIKQYKQAVNQQRKAEDSFKRLNNNK